VVAGVVVVLVGFGGFASMPLLASWASICCWTATT
jgi:hypothetical protein